MANDNGADTEAEEEDTSLRYEWLSTLKAEELRILCRNRAIDTDASTKKALISSILKHKASRSSTANYERSTKATLLLELQAIGISKPSSTSKSELIECLNDNKDKKPSKAAMSDLSVSELTKLCQRRKIQTKKKNLSSKQSLVQLLETSNLPDPKYTDSMTNKQLMAELKGRGLSFSGMNKQQMIETLNSGICYEEQKLKQHLDANNVDHVIERARVALTEYIDYLKENKEIIQKCTKLNTLKNTKRVDDVYGTDWRKIEDVLRTTREELYESRAMLEAYGNLDFGRDEEMPHIQKFQCVVNYDNDSDVNQEDLVYVVYDEDDDLVMRQSKRAVLAVFEDEKQAEKFRKKQLKKDKEMEVGIQEVEMNVDFGAEEVAN